MEQQGLAAVLEQTSVQRIRGLLEERPDAVITLTDVAGQMLWVSARGCEGLLSRDPATLEGRDGFAFVHPEDLAKVRADFDRAVSGEAAQYDYRGRVADGTFRRFSTVAWPVDGPDGRVVLTVTVALPEAS